MFSLRNLAQEQTELFIGYCTDTRNRFIRDYINQPRSEYLKLKIIQNFELSLIYILVELD